MDIRNTAQRAPPASATGMDHEEEMMAELDEPPDEMRWSPTKLHFDYIKTNTSVPRRESLLTRQLHSETDHTDDDQSLPGRAMSLQSTQSTQSGISMADLISDDGHSVPSPHISPPLAPTEATPRLPLLQVKQLNQRVQVVGQDGVVSPTSPATNQEKVVEANLGRKRCISFACRGKEEPKPAPTPTSEPAEVKPASPPKRKCMLKFVCPSRSGAESTASQKTQTKRTSSPPAPPVRRSSSKVKHRGSDSTVTHASPKSVRKAIAVDKALTSRAAPTNTYAADSDEADSSNEATRFHEFATSDDEPEGWVQESTCHRSRLTVDDTLRKENIIRKTCEEAAEEEDEEDEEIEEEALADEMAAVDEINGTLTMDDIEDESDEGFHSDDEGGFASSDSERDDDSDYEWWRPGGASTAATSVEHLDRLATFASQQVEPASSLNSMSSAQSQRHPSKRHSRNKAFKPDTSKAIPINRRPSVDLPDSTDFVCGTLDEDRPLEQAYINRKKALDDAKRPARPQDIDPSFPTSDPEMDEEDDDDVNEVPSSDDEEDMVHGEMEELHDLPPRRLSLRPRGRPNGNRSPPPPRAQSPAPKRTMAKSPAPVKRHRSPPPRKLFGHSPHRTKSPAPGKRTTSPPNSPNANGIQIPPTSYGFVGRPQLTHTASLPRGGPMAATKLAHWGSDHDDATDTGIITEVPRRGAIDIVKGVEFKRQLRKRKLLQKQCAKNAHKGEKAHKVKPGKGAERMREVGLQLQQYRGRAEHILSL